MRTGVVTALSRDGVRVRFGPTQDVPYQYALVEGPAGVDPAELRERVPDARWYDETIIALAIEPAPQDVLPHLLHALRGPGAPAGISDAYQSGAKVVVEIRASVTQPAMVLRIVDVELSRFHGFRRMELLAPLPAGVVAEIAARGLQAPEIGPDRILESLLESAHVE